VTNVGGGEDYRLGPVNSGCTWQLSFSKENHKYQKGQRIPEYVWTPDITGRLPAFERIEINLSLERGTMGWTARVRFLAGLTFFCSS
jgi:hypothetical protein